MLRWATIFFAIPLLVAIVGMGGIAASAAEIAMGLFVVSLIAFIMTFFVTTPDDEEDRYEGEWQN
ncbi:DUF1328 domain-containing protein [Pigmentiphaga litoralis]|uniref:UPF0391 membrane protein FHW18_001688 n=1 Tax=Pigmentiphaga litoralis TaxID=516702 RepID=A0A7Y9ISW7_9BURK|nr:DUF1328 domain-containing protein [Pigmentiphaga litoralis]NYE23969.1 uncharacterized membrane protein YtjA (UPF0391 family) [Pigmentiphaga litoralis]NYE82417.1 uncharacterized membrane protein YtjA (UPF0391 family) [Pigmentiphaga litoralis]